MEQDGTRRTAAISGSSPMRKSTRRNCRSRRRARRSLSAILAASPSGRKTSTRFTFSLPMMKTAWLIPTVWNTAILPFMTGKWKSALKTCTSSRKGTGKKPTGRKSPERWSTSGSRKPQNWPPRRASAAVPASCWLSALVRYLSMSGPSGSRKKSYSSRRPHAGHL